MNEKRDIVGYAAGIAAGVSYGLNPLFAKDLMADGVTTGQMLLYRYAIALVLMALWMAIKGEPFKVKPRQFPLLILMGLLFSGSSLTLFLAYRFIPSGLATTLVYLYPAFTAIMLVMAGKKQSGSVWAAIAGTLAGVVLLCWPDGGVVLHWAGLLLSAGSALLYAIYLVIVNNDRSISDVSAHTITLYALATGTVLFATITISGGDPVTGIINSWHKAADVAGLAIFPTMISLLMLSIATRRIGATRTAVLGVFEPVTALLIGVCIFGEPMTTRMAGGIALCLAAILFLVISDNRRRN